MSNSDLAYPLGKDSFAILGSLNCESLPVADLKMHVTQYIPQKLAKMYVAFYLIWGQQVIYIRDCI